MCVEALDWLYMRPIQRDGTARITFEHFKAAMIAAGNLVKQDRYGRLVLISALIENSGYKEARWPFSRAELEKLGWTEFVKELEND